MYRDLPIQTFDYIEQALDTVFYTCLRILFPGCGSLDTWVFLRDWSLPVPLLVASYFQ